MDTPKHPCLSCNSFFPGCESCEMPQEFAKLIENDTKYGIPINGQDDSTVRYEGPDHTRITICS